jgi:alpha-D-ribose 1-methylphosphonate 5-triphosphate synthase subunit PhnG
MPPVIPRSACTAFVVSSPCHVSVTRRGFIKRSENQSKTRLEHRSSTIDSLSGPILSTTEQAPHAAESLERRTRAKSTPESRHPESRHDADRRAAMAVLADALVDEIEQGLRSLAEPVDHVELRAVETGLVMLRGRIGGDGAPFNLGEATVTRAAVQIASGEVGFAYILGRDQKKARLCAVCDALWQSKRHRDAVERRVLAPIRARLEAERGEARAQTAATRVDFLTLVRGED